MARAIAGSLTRPLNLSLQEDLGWRYNGTTVSHMKHQCVGSVLVEASGPRWKGPENKSG